MIVYSDPGRWSQSLLVREACGGRRRTGVRDQRDAVA
jgi:hypothetical protein